MTSACIFAPAGPALTAGERAFFADADPWAFNVFARNCIDPDQLRALTAELRDCVGRNALIFVDQEGGRVQRMRPPHWRAAPPAAAFGRLYEIDAEAGLAACRLNHLMLAAELADVGLDADFAPVLDLPAEGADPIIGDRAFGAEPDAVAALGAAAIEGLAAGGCAAVIKHMPGHGRATVDSHLKLPVIDADLETLRATDFAPFRMLAGQAAIAMTAHVVMTAVDPDRPVTTSPTAMETVVRGEIGFDGLVMTDDIEMKALGGSLQHRARASIAAGCDILLHCSGDLASMRDMMEETPALAGRALERAQRAEARGPDGPCDLGESGRMLAELMAPLEPAA